jgi:predicted anti-sigma-YlaC factor YlaD
MNLQTATTEQFCLQADIASYLDGELAPPDEIVLEKHLAVCKNCLDELNLQKKMLSALDFAFNDRNKKAEIKLPENFAKVIATTAESKVSGLRQPEERFRALYLCFGLFLLVLIGLGAETGKMWTAFTEFTEQIVVVSTFIFHFIYDVAIGLCIISRALSQQFVVSSIFPILLILCIFIFSFIILSRFVVRYNRS